jgi:hypothetical protein
MRNTFCFRFQSLYYRMIQIRKHQVRIFPRKMIEFIIDVDTSSILTIEVKSPVLELPQYLRNRFAKQRYIPISFLLIEFR